MEENQHIEDIKHELLQFQDEYAKQIKILEDRIDLLCVQIYELRGE